ncbi:hypothetical protein [Chitinimonas naiadis]
MKHLKNIPSLVVSIAVLTLTPAQADSTRYKHSHHTTQSELTNQDVNFGSPGSGTDVDRTVTLAITSSGDLTQRAVLVRRNERLQFALKNDSQAPVAFVVGDAQAVQEYADLYRDSPSSAMTDFHGIVMKPGLTQSFAWKFDTFGNPRMFAAFVGVDGTYAGKIVQFNFLPLRGKR